MMQGSRDQYLAQLPLQLLLVLTLEHLLMLLRWLHTKQQGMSANTPQALLSDCIVSFGHAVPPLPGRKLEIEKATQVILA